MRQCVTRSQPRSKKFRPQINRLAGHLGHYLPRPSRASPTPHTDAAVFLCRPHRFAKLCLLQFRPFLAIYFVPKRPTRFPPPTFLQAPFRLNMPDRKTRRTASRELESGPFPTYTFGRGGPSVRRGLGEPALKFEHLGHEGEHNGILPGPFEQKAAFMRTGTVGIASTRSTGNL